MTELVTVLVAMVITAVMASTITAMSLSPIKTQRQKSNHATAEGLAIAIRKGIVDDTTTFDDDTDITDANVKAASFYSALNISGDSSCTVKNAYTPFGTGVVVPYAVECKVGRDGDRQQAVAWQPLYTMKNFAEQVGAGTTPLSLSTCLIQWLTDSSAQVPSKPSSANPVTVNLSSYTNCQGNTSLVINDESDWSSSKRNPCKVEDIKQDGTIKVKFNSNNDAC